MLPPDIRLSDRFRSPINCCWRKPRHIFPSRTHFNIRRPGINLCVQRCKRSGSRPICREFNNSHRSGRLLCRELDQSRQSEGVQSLLRPPRHPIFPVEARRPSIIWEALRCATVFFALRRDGPFFAGSYFRRADPFSAASDYLSISDEVCFNCG